MTTPPSTTIPSSARFSVNYGFDEQNITPEKKQKKQKKQKGGSVLPLNKIPWVKRVNLA